MRKSVKHSRWDRSLTFCLRGQLQTECSLQKDGEDWGLLEVSYALKVWWSWPFFRPGAHRLLVFPIFSLYFFLGKPREVTQIICVSALKWHQGGLSRCLETVNTVQQVMYLENLYTSCSSIFHLSFLPSWLSPFALKPRLSEVASSSISSSILSSFTFSFYHSKVIFLSPSGWAGASVVEARCWVSSRRTSFLVRQQLMNEGAIKRKCNMASGTSDLFILITVVSVKARFP